MKVVDGGWRLGATRVFYGWRPPRPWPRSAVFVEEDTGLVMSPSLDASGAHGDHAIRVHTALHEFEPPAPGATVLRRRQPLALALLVFDLGATPIAQPQWVRTALAAAFATAHGAGYQAVRMPLLGVRRGALSVRDFTGALDEALRGLPADRQPRRIWLERRATDGMDRPGRPAG